MNIQAAQGLFPSTPSELASNLFEALKGVGKSREDPSAPAATLAGAPITARLPLLESIGDRASEKHRVADAQQRSRDVTLTFEKTDENIVSISVGDAGREGVVADVHLSKDGKIDGFDTDLGGQVDSTVLSEVNLGDSFGRNIQLSLVGPSAAEADRDLTVSAFHGVQLSVSTVVALQDIAQPAQAPAAGDSDAAAPSEPEASPDSEPDSEPIETDDDSPKGNAYGHDKDDWRRTDALRSG